MDRPRSFALAFVAYSALRILLFAVPLVVIYWLSANAVLSAVLAAVIGLALSIILLGGQRETFVSRLRQRAEGRRRTDETAEDDAVEASGDQAATSAPARPKP